MADTSRSPDPDTKLPVTGEVGDEGGSYADATVQAETFTGDNPRVDGSPPAAPAAPARARRDDESPAEGTRKYPTE